MFLYEFDETKPLVSKIVVATDQLRTDVEKGLIQNWSVDNLLDYYSKYNIILDKDNLYSMIQKDPLKQVVKNIQGSNVVFKGQDDDTKTKPDENKKIVKQMANKTLTK